jgi:hypothetical protein
MALEQLANNASSTLGSSINSSVTSLTVASAATFPSSGEFRILIDTEIMKVTAVSSTTFTVSRGVEGTTAASHTSGAAVTGILTADAMRAYRENNNYFSAYSSRPTAAVVNRLFKPTDFPILQRDTGSLWTSIYGPSIDLVTPDDSGFSWTNQGSATVDTSLYGTYIECATNGNADNYRIRSKSHSSPKKYTVAFTLAFQSDNSGGGGLLWRQSSTGKIISTIIWGNINSSVKLITENWTNPTSFSGSVGSYFVAHILNPNL